MTGFVTGFLGFPTFTHPPSRLHGREIRCVELADSIERGEDIITQQGSQKGEMRRAKTSRSDAWLAQGFFRYNYHRGVRMDSIHCESVNSAIHATSCPPMRQGLHVEILCSGPVSNCYNPSCWLDVRWEAGMFGWVGAATLSLGEASRPDG